MRCCYWLKEANDFKPSYIFNKMSSLNPQVEMRAYRRAKILFSDFNLGQDKLASSYSDSDCPYRCYKNLFCEIFPTDSVFSVLSKCLFYR